jgi:hypothetical protein
MKTTMPAMLEGAAIAFGMTMADAATIMQMIVLKPTRLLTRRSTAQS